MLCIYHLFARSNFNSLHISLRITLPTQCCLVLYSFIIIIYSFRVYHMVFHWSLRDSKCPQVSRTLLSILAVLDNAVVWMVSTRPPTSKSSRPFKYLSVFVVVYGLTCQIIVNIRNSSMLLRSDEEVFIKETM